ncbi:MAG TPA: hypothetical protein VFS44_07185 [Gemmatimonadaceae bacterium]|nr:hypothetical protein [Gemmatimonadaceae bacterium]
MTVPLTPGLPAPFTPPVHESFQFPVSWLLDNAAAPIQFRASTEVARLPLRDPRQFGILPYGHRPALTIAFQQRPDGIWNGSMLSVPSPRAEHFQGIGTITAVRRLLEYGWERESPPLVQARRTLFRLLAEDTDAAYLFELAPRGKPEPEVVLHGRALLREAAAAVLAQAGYESDPRLRGAALRLVERVDGFLRSPLAAKPFVRVGNQHVLAPGASPPSIFYLAMLAHMPHFRSEHYDVMERLYAYLVQPMPRQEAVTLVGKKVVAEPQLVLGDPLPHRNAADADLPAALYWLELMARLGMLRRNEGWAKLFERYLDDRDASGVWRAPKRNVGTRTSNPFVWPAFPLEPHATSDALSADVTFRLGLIARLMGRTIEPT